MKHKSAKRLLIFIIFGAAAASGICGGLYAVRSRQKAEVISVELLNSGYWGDDVSGTGVIRNDAFQEVKLPQDAQIKEVCVEEGQEVRTGDPLLVLDTVSADLEYQIKILEVEKLQNQIDIAKNELQILKKTKPYVPEDILEPAGYTEEELKQMTARKEQEISGLDLSKRKAELEVEKLKQKQTDGVIRASVDGTVKHLQDGQLPPADGTAFLEVAGSGGLSVSGTISEFLLGQVQPGQTVTVSSWESGMSCEAVIREIGSCPASGQGYGGNPNVSWYPYTACIEDGNGADFRNGESVDLHMTVTGEESAESIYLPKMYVRSGGGRSYVMKADENNRLKKQFVETGRVINGDTIEIRTGVVMEDRLAFPYGKTVREGARTFEKEDSGV